MDAPIPRPVGISRVSVDAVTFTKITAPIDCNNITLSTDDQVNGFYFYTTNADDTTRVTVLPYNAFVVNQGVFHPGTGFRFPIGSTVGWIKAVAGTGPIVITVVR